MSIIRTTKLMSTFGDSADLSYATDKTAEGLANMASLMLSSIIRDKLLLYFREHEEDIGKLHAVSLELFYSGIGVGVLRIDEGAENDR